MENKKEYISPDLSVILFNDIITTSEEPVETNNSNGESNGFDTDGYRFDW